MPARVIGRTRSRLEWPHEVAVSVQHWPIAIGDRNFRGLGGGVCQRVSNTSAGRDRPAGLRVDILPLLFRGADCASLCVRGGHRKNDRQDVDRGGDLRRRGLRGRYRVGLVDVGMRPLRTFGNDRGRPMKFRSLRIAASFAGATTCVLLAAWWVRSYSRLEVLEGRVGLDAIQMSSVSGRIAIGHVDRSAILGKTYVNEVAGNAAEWRKGGRFGFAILDDGLVTALIVPYWLPAFLSAAVAVLPWTSQKWHFSVRTLLIAITLVALLLGVLVWTARRL